MDQILTYILSAVGILGFYLAGKKVWWAWYVNIANQVLWTVFSVITQQWGFLLATAFYLVVFIKNAVAWTKEHYAKKNESIKAYDISESGEDDKGIYLKAVPAKTMGMRYGYIKPPKTDLQVDEEAINSYMQIGETDPAVANEIAYVVSDVMRAHGKDWVQLSERYGIAHEVQRRLDVKLTGTRPDEKVQIVSAIYQIDNATRQTAYKENHTAIPNDVSRMLYAMDFAKRTLQDILKGK